MTKAERERFDLLVSDAIDALPRRFRDFLDEAPVIAIDRPTPDMVRRLKADGVLPEDEDGSDLCGLHTGVGITDRSIEDPSGWGPMSHSGAGPEHIHLFREGIVDLAGGWDAPHADENVYEEIRITLLHEIGHHFGLGEDDLDDLGYG